jgi:hypothetical protein
MQMSMKPAPPLSLIWERTWPMRIAMEMSL